MAGDIQIKRAYADPSADDGRRFLVDRVWPRGRSREVLELEAWLREVAPSDPLRTWFGHDPGRWEAFRARYFGELESRPGSWEPLARAAERGRVTLVYGARDTERNNAAALRDFLLERSGGAEAEPG